MTQPQDSAAWLITSSRKGIASTQLAREIGVTQKTAWFMLGRLREVAAAMGEEGGVAPDDLPRLYESHKRLG